MQYNRCIPNRKLLCGACLSLVLAFVPVSVVRADEKTGAHVAGAEIPLAPKDGGPRRWQLKAGDSVPLHRAPSADTKLPDVIPDGAILSNFGCEQAEGRIWCKVRALHGKLTGYITAEHLIPAVAPDGSVPLGVDDSVKRARKRSFDAQGTVPCIQVRGQKPGQCKIGVARGNGGDATVVATFSNSFARTLYFVHEEFISANATMSGVGTDTDWQVEDGTHFIRVEDQRYELPHTLIFGKEDHAAD